MKRTLTYALLPLLGAFSLNAACDQPAKENGACQMRCAGDGFVRVQGDEFMLNGKPYRYFGVNYWYAAYLGANVEAGGRERLIRELDHLQSLGVTNLRVCGASEKSTITTLEPSFQPEPGVYNEELLEGLDFALAEMAKRGMKAVIYLNNTWRWSGGMAQYQHWANGLEFKLEDDDWHGFNHHMALFFENEPANELYHRYMEMLINRQNTVNGRLYKDDSTIMSWQICNEPRPGNWETVKEVSPAYIEWIKNTAAFIRSLDSKHLISTGSEGVWGCNGAEDTYRSSQSYVDYLTVHLWPYNWSWYNPKDEVNTAEAGIAKSLEYIQQHVAIAAEMNQPLVLEEFGLPRDGGSYDPASTTVWRDRFYQDVADLLTHADKGGLDGINVWSFSGEGKPVDLAGKEWVSGEPFTGDNPVEPQGMNAIFREDTSTLNIIGEANKSVQQKCPKQ